MEDADEAFAHPHTPPPKKRARLESTASSMDTETSCLGSLPSDVSFIEEEQREEALGHGEFYSLIVAEQAKYTAKGKTMFSWKAILESLKTKHPYFQGKDKDAIRARFSYVKKQLKKKKLKK